MRTPLPVFLLLLLLPAFSGCENDAALGGRVDSPSKDSKDTVPSIVASDSSITSPKDTLIPGKQQAAVPKATPAAARKWEKYWQERLPGFYIDSFAAYNTGTYKPERTGEIESPADNDTSHFTSPDGRYQLEYSNAGMDAESDAYLIDMKKRVRYFIGSQGSFGYYDDVAWLDNTTFVLFCYGKADYMADDPPYTFYYTIVDMRTRTTRTWCSDKQFRIDRKKTR